MDLSSKSEGYNSLKQYLAVPSTPVCFYTMSVILKSYSSIIGLYGYIFAILFFILFIITLALTLYRYKKIINNKKRIIGAGVITIVIIFLITFFLDRKIKDLISDIDLDQQLVNVTVIIDDVTYKRYSSEIYFHGEDNNKVKGIIYYQGDTVFNKGDSIFLHKKINKINNRNFFETYLISCGIRYSSAITDNDITILNRGEPTLLKHLQNNILEKVGNVFKEPAAGVIKALLSGNQNYIEKKIILQYRDSGALHSLAASGLHVAIFASIPALLFIPILRKNSAMLISLFFVISYLLITDIPVSLLRAVVMFGLYYLQLLFFRKRNVFNYLMLTCSIVLWISPWEIFTPGFQLSFGATASIILFYNRYRKSLNDFPKFFADAMAVTLSAQITALPIILFHMNQLNTVGIAGNIIIIPLITLIMWTALFAISISVFSIYLATIFGYITSFLFKITLLVTKFLSELKLNFYVYDVTPLLIMILLIAIIPLINHKKFIRLKFYPILISTVLSIAYLKTNNRHNDPYYLITDNNSKIELLSTGKTHTLRLDLAEGIDYENIITTIKMRNPSITSVELSKNNNANLIVLRRLLNDYPVHEVRFTEIQNINSIFNSTILRLEKDKIAINFGKQEF
ncbi:MAG: competence protein ComEC family protein [Leptospirales bacterium]|nr:competence protein ComEC family protein [Leptospirales bacterium]